MARTHSESSEDFEFIETPAAPAATPPPEDCGVKRTNVSCEKHTLHKLFIDV
jgi:sphingolipid C9-methyltransferase